MNRASPFPRNGVEAASGDLFAAREIRWSNSLPSEVNEREDYEVGVQILGNAQHTGAAKFRGERKTIAFEFGSAAGVRIDLLLPACG